MTDGCVYPAVGLRNDEILKMTKPYQTMAILNITPDSFHDGGEYVTVEKAVQHAKELVAQGADIIDVGGESTRPGATPISTAEELARIIPVIKEIKSLPVTICVDTYKPEVMQQAIDAGALMINDIKALTMSGAKKIIAKTGVKVCLMHHTAAISMQVIKEDLQAIIDSSFQAGIKVSQIIVDPGFGFGKKGEQNWQLLNELDQLIELGYPVLVGLSRKSMDLQRSINAAKLALTKGASIIRVHDVAHYARLLI